MSLDNIQQVDYALSRIPALQYLHDSHYQGTDSCLLFSATEIKQSTAAPRIYPNPFTKQFSIEWPQDLPMEEGCTIKLFDFYGRLCLESRLSTPTVIVENSALLPGMYILQVENGEKIWHYKVVKE